MRQRSNVKSKISNHKWARPLDYKVDPNDPTVLILRNGMRIKQKEGLDLFLSLKGAVYALTKCGLRRRRINYTRRTKDEAIHQRPLIPKRKKKQKRKLK